MERKVSMMMLIKFIGVGFIFEKEEKRSKEKL